LQQEDKRTKTLARVPDMVWTCGTCTFENANDAGTGCEICETPRHGGPRSDRSGTNDEDRASEDGKGERNSHRAESAFDSGSALPRKRDDDAEFSSKQQQPSSQVSTTSSTNVSTTLTTTKPSLSTRFRRSAKRARRTAAARRGAERTWRTHHLTEMLWCRTLRRPPLLAKERLKHGIQRTRELLLRRR
jgi:hypothetical protein